MSDLDQRVRLAAFTFLDQQTLLHGRTLPRDVLAAGFMFDGTRVPLLGPQGIFKPAVLDLPLSITTVPPVEGKPRPYDDEMTPDGLLRYRYRGTDADHRDNVGLQTAMQQQVPLAYFLGVVPGRYMASLPAYIVGDDPQTLAFTSRSMTVSSPWQVRQRPRKHRRPTSGGGTSPGWFDSDSTSRRSASEFF